MSKDNRPQLGTPTRTPLVVFDRSSFRLAELLGEEAYDEPGEEFCNLLRSLDPAEVRPQNPVSCLIH